MHRLISGRIRELGLDASHFGGRLRQRVAEIELTVLAECVRRTLWVAEICQSFGLPDVGRAHYEMKRRILEEGLNTAHHRGRGWALGETAATHPGLASLVKKNRFRDEEVFVESSPITDGRALVKRLLEEDWQCRCKHCGISEWQGQRLVLHLDHVNGISNDNRRENLRLLCPNCHSQTDTYCNRARPSRAGESRGFYSCYTSRARACCNW